MLGTRTRGANESTELWRHPLPLFLFVSCYFISHHFLYFFWWSVGMSVLVSLLMSELILISKMFQFPSNLRLCRYRRRRHHNWCLSILPHRHQWNANLLLWTNVPMFWQPQQEEFEPSGHWICLSRVRSFALPNPLFQFANIKNDFRNFICGRSPFQLFPWAYSIKLNGSVNYGFVIASKFWP